MIELDLSGSEKIAIHLITAFKARKGLIMKKFMNSMYWIGVLMANVFGYLMLAFLFALSLGLPNEMWSGFVGIGLVIFGIVFTADEETLELLKRFAKKDSSDVGD